MTLVCPDCFDRKGLSYRIVDIRPNYDEGKCDFHPKKKGVPIEDVAKILDEVIRHNYYPIYADMHGRNPGMDLNDLLYDLLEPTDDATVEELQKILIEEDDFWPPDGEDAFFDEDLEYKLIGNSYDEQHSRRWAYFCDLIMHDQRFFNSKAMEALREIFDGIHLLKDESGISAIYEIETTHKPIFRARIANDSVSQTKIYNRPGVELAAPPKRKRSSGRMNPSGIQTFYGAMDDETCVSELRPAVGETVMSGEFKFIRPILVLDTTKFGSSPKAMDIFTKTYNKRRSLWAFMSQFMNEIRQPYLPSDEHLDYIPTQVVAEYLTNLHKFKRNSKMESIEGIIFRSAQNKQGKNIALFGEAAKVLLKSEGGEDSFKLTSESQPGLAFIGDSVRARKVNSVSFTTNNVYISAMDKDLPF